jgi:hypothetical protein
MAGTAIFWPMIVHVFLVYAVYLLMLVRRRKAVMSGSTKISSFRENLNEPPESLFVRNNLANQFELPVIFHVACLALYVTGAVGTFVVAMAWIFALSRIVHSYIHVTSNRIRYRQPAFSVGFFATLILWLALVVHLLANA